MSELTDSNKPNETQQEKTNDSEAKVTEIKRREFLRKLSWGSLGVGGVMLSGISLDMFWPRKISGFGSKVKVGPVSDFPVNTVTRVNKGKFYLAHLPEGLMALYWKCPHLGCTVPWEEAENLFICPCHGSVYEPTGNRIAGPAPRPMDYMKIDIIDGEIVVDTGQIFQRTKWEAGQAVKV
ncbi:MAG: Rieske 2Fe-2S domain-containing protein [Thermincola sp.]|nr:Rieske 2Fe-2S domain-containing protein [Thermincola sp.]